jgi:hypothetical protein
MNQKSPIITLRDFVEDDSPFGNDQGQAAYAKIQKELNKHPNAKIVGVSLKGIKRTDASFPRESIISLAKVKRGEMGFYLKDVASKDILDNWEYAARAKEQPLFVYDGKDWSVLGFDLGEDMKKLFDFIIKNETVTTSIVAEKFKLTAPNASMKLKKLLNQGLLVGSKETAESGGLEYIFSAIK